MKGRPAAYAIGLGATAIAVALALLPNREIVYSRQLTLIGCDQVKPQEHCYAWARLSIGNTGNVDQDVVRVRLPRTGTEWRVDFRSSDLRASRDPRADPRIERLNERDAAIYEIRPMPRNTVVDFNAYCLACAEAAIRGMSASQVTVEADGRASEGDPRTVRLLSALGQLLSSLIPFR